MWPDTRLPQALLGYALETRLAGVSTGNPEVAVSSPWDLWWVCFRTAIPSGTLGITATVTEGFCARCAADARELSAADPPRHPGITPGQRRCRCLEDWAVQMRAAAAPVTWPPLSLILALIKPGAPAGALRTRLERTCDIVEDQERALTVADVRRLYPEAYGAGFVGAVDAFLTSAPVRVLVLRWRHGQPGDLALFKQRLRAELGAAGVMRNHLHMADNPAEALADIRHLAGQDLLAGLYERHEHAHGASRISFYRAALGIREARPDGTPR